MADFTTEVFQNEFLPDGGTDVHAIVRVTSTGASTGASEGRLRLGSARLGRRGHPHRHVRLDGTPRRAGRR